MKYISLKKAEEILKQNNKPYLKGYLSILARNGKLKSIKLANEWLTTEQWLNDFLKEENKHQREQFSLMNKKEKTDRERVFEKLKIKSLHRPGLC